MYDIRNFTLKDMVETSAALRRMGAGAVSMEQVADRIVHYLDDQFVDRETGEKSFVLVRFFKTHPYEELDEDLRVFARGMLGAPPESPAMKCLTLLASAGALPEWNSRKSSAGHKAIPLPSEQFVEQFPMIRQLVQQLGLEVSTVLQPDPEILVDLAQTTYNVFYIPEAVGSQYVVAQQEFVIPFNVRSVLGCGGILPSGNLFAIIIFPKVHFPRETADLFKTVALSVKTAVLPFDGKVFSPDSRGVGEEEKRLETNTTSDDVDLLRIEVAALNELLEVHEKVVSKQSAKLEQAFRELREESELREKTITELKEAERELAKSFLYTRSLIEASLDPLVTINPNGKIMDVNKATEEATGIDRATLSGSDFSDYFTEPDKAREGYRQVFSQGFVRDYPLALRHTSGRAMGVLYNATIYKNAAGEVQGVFAAARDVTDRKQAEQKAAQLAAIVQSSDDAIIGKTLDGIITSWNKGAEKVYGYHESEVIGQPISILVPPGHEDEVPQILAKLKLGEHIDHYESVRRRKDGHSIDVSLTVSLIRDAEGKIVAASSIGRDISERKQAEEALAAERQRLFSVLETMPAYVGLLTPDYQVAFANRYFKESFGEPEGRRCYEYMFGRSDPCENCQAYKVLETKTPQAYEWLGPDGRTYQIYDQIMHDTDGSPLILEMGIDITERKRVEEALRESEEKYRLLVNQIPAVVFHGYGDWGVDFFDHKIESLTGYRKEEFDSRKIKWCDLILPEDLDKAQRIFIEALKTNKSYVREYRIRRKDGEIRWVQCRGQISCDAEGSIEYVSGVMFDITEPKRAHESLRRAKEEWELTFDAVPDLIAILDTQHRIVRVNRAMADRLGVAPNKAIGSFCFEVVHHLESPPGFCPHLHLLKDGREHQAEVHEPALGGDFLVTVSPLYNHEGHLSGSVHVAHDLSERKQMERERLRLAKLEAVGVLAGGIAHDFNNVLMGVLGNISLASMASSASEAHERLVAAEAACGQAQSLAQHLLTFAKGGAPVKKPQNLKEIVQGVTKMALSGSQSRVELFLPDQLWYVEVDRSQMEQVFSNLFINADQAMPTGGLIQVEAENLEVTAGSRLPLAPGKYVMVTLKDQGIGISPELLERIFDPYFTTKQKGSGLGLATTLSIVTQHGGYIMVDSQLGRGATFRLYLPAQEEAGLPEKPVEAKPLEGHGRILVMDDDPLVREVMDKMLRKLGYEPVFAQEGREALELYARGQASGEPFAAVILDLTIPGGMGGTEAIQHLLAQDPQVKAVVSSGYADDTIMADFKAFGFQGVIAKPYRLADLARVLQEVLNLSFSATLD